MPTPPKYHKNPRIPGNDYAKGTYFFTICTYQWRRLFGQIITSPDGRNKMELNDAGRIVDECLSAIPEHFPNVMLHQMQIMPDHLHAIIAIIPQRSTQCVAATIVPDLEPALPKRGRGPAPGSLGAIIGAFKSETTKRINRLRGTPGERIWLHGYHEHQIRTSSGEIGRISRYIEQNPQKWRG